MEKELERRFLSRLGEHLVSLPFDLKVLYEALSDPDLERPAREMAAGAVVYVLLPSDILVDRDNRLASFADDVILLRVALKRVAELGGETVETFLQRFPEEYDQLDDDLQLYRDALGDLFPWLADKLETFGKLIYKGRRAIDYLDDEESETFLYDEWLTFRTEYEITEDRLEGRLRRAAPIIEALERRRAEDAKRIS